MSHPYLRFRAPSSIRAGSAMSTVLGPQAVALIAESFVAVHPGFDPARFQRRALVGLDDLAILGRGDHIADALAGELPADVPAAIALVVAALGPPLPRTEGNGLAPFFYLPHGAWLSRHAAAHPRPALAAIRELTRRFTGEFAIRRFLIDDPAGALAVVAPWAADPDPHVRRLVTEGTRPRLPWAPRLPAFQRDPTPVLPVLDALVDDPVRYVQRSVANHLGDILKDHPDLGCQVARRWLQHAPPGPAGAARRWIVRHAVRLPAKHGDPQALALRQAAR